MEAREQKGLEIAAKSKLQRAGDRWFVPSQSGHPGTYYTVKPDPAKPHCSCPDFECRQLRCKHIFAVEYVIQRKFNQQHFMAAYHKRSNVESTFSMIKAKFGDRLRSKTRTAQITKPSAKFLCITSVA
jgi:hypothetical protein